MCTYTQNDADFFGNLCQYKRDSTGEVLDHYKCNKCKFYDQGSCVGFPYFEDCLCNFEYDGPFCNSSLWNSTGNTDDPEGGTTQSTTDDPNNNNVTSSTTADLISNTTSSTTDDPDSNTTSTITDFLDNNTPSNTFVDEATEDGGELVDDAEGLLEDPRQEVTEGEESLLGNAGQELRGNGGIR